MIIYRPFRHIKIKTECSHSWSAWSYEWADDCSLCTATRQCTTCSVTETIYAARIEPRYVPPTCESTGGNDHLAYWDDPTIESPRPCTCWNDPEEPLGHDWQWAAETPPTCTNVGFTYYECSRCDETKKEEIPAKHTNLSYGHEYTDNPTCTNVGITYRYDLCLDCGAELNTTAIGEIPATGHTWVDATCTKPKTCSTCGETEGRSLGHSMTEKAYEQYGSDTWHDTYEKCSICGQTGLPQGTEPHEFTNDGYTGYCKFCGQPCSHPGETIEEGHFCSTCGVRLA